MKRLVRTVVAIIIALACTALLIVTADAETRYFEKVFSFGSYAPNVHIINAGLGSALDVKVDGSISWKKLLDNNDYNDTSQCFTILPAGSGYYVIVEVLPIGGHNPRCLTYIPGKGFVMDWPKNGKYSDAQMFRFKWYSSTSCGGRSIKNCWRIFCKKDSIAFCTGGWSTVKVRQDNWSENY